MKKEKLEHTAERISLASREADDWFNKAFNYIFSQIPSEKNYAVGLFRRDNFPGETGEALDVYAFKSRKEANRFLKDKKNASQVGYRHGNKP